MLAISILGLKSLVPSMLAISPRGRKPKSLILNDLRYGKELLLRLDLNALMCYTYWSECETRPYL